MPRAVIVIATLIAAGTESRADPAAAARAEAEADVRGNAKDFLGAAAKYREAYAADPRPDLICNVGVAYHKAQELPRAQLYLGRCLERGSALRSQFIDAVRATLSKIEASLKAGSYTPVDVVVEPRFATVAIDAFAPDETFDGGRTVWLPFGSYHVTVRAEGYLAQTVALDARNRAVYPLRITLEREPVVVAPPREPEPAVPTGPALRPADPERPPAAVAPSSSLTVPIATAAAAVTFAAVAVYARSQAGSHAERAGFALTSDDYHAEADSAGRWNTIFGVGLAAAGVSAAASGYLWYRVLSAPAPAAHVEVSAHGASITVAGRF